MQRADIDSDKNKAIVSSSAKELAVNNYALVNNANYCQVDSYSIKHLDKKEEKGKRKQSN